MISYLRGRIIIKKDKFIILDVNGVGYKVFIAKRNFAKIPEIEKEIKLFCFLDVGESKMNLYGFLSLKELEFFEILEGIRGVGPKAALEISSLGSLDEIKKRVLEKDSGLFEGIPGIGKKKAMTIILELTGKIKEFVPSKTMIDEAEEGLVNLGFSREKAKQALTRISGEIKDVEERIKQALKFLGK
jgi:Holliday junction DNA helicase RuvA